jgi:hypothetical protein
MTAHFNVIDPDSLMKIMVDAISEIAPDDLAYLFATGKSELEIRNQIALYLHRNSQDNQIVTREWKRHDLAILEHGKPKLLIEGKSWIHADAVSPKKMFAGSRSIIAGLESDIKKMYATEEEYPGVNNYITTILFTVDVQRASKARLQDSAITYAGSHLRGIKSHENASELAGRGRGALSSAFASYGIVKREPLNSGYFHEFKVEADLFLLKPEVTFLGGHSET